MISFQYDSEAVIQDADVFIEQQNNLYRLEKKAIQQGVCFHSSWLGLADDGTIYYPEQKLLTDSEVICTDSCAQIFDTEEDLVNHQRDLYIHWTGSY